MSMRQPPPDPKSRRNHTASAKVADTNNTEAPTAAHQHVLATKPILDLIKRMGKLSSQLPETVPEASAADKVHRVITTVHGIDDTVARTFNRRFDVLFGEDCRDSDGRLENIRRGDDGMKCVVTYLQSIHWESAGVPVDLAQQKLTRVIDELQYLCASEVTAKRPAVPNAGASKENQQLAASKTKKKGSSAFERAMDRE
ncbi:hypothetical protein B0H17DRAFT_5085 [Mycena rosella]|uniref:Uncharacterized protein n=1 Tax=Mycena rosella TaxID=1033263 RepID=A0AAD7MCG8_MYCRO|nr:hypothetical protein B0H17DRAFT_5085 [Mycena rosella]